MYILHQFEPVSPVRVDALAALAEIVNHAALVKVSALTVAAWSERTQLAEGRTA
jgi:hypothetical protein